MAEQYHTGRYNTCNGCYCWILFHGISDSAHAERLVSKGFKLVTETIIKENQPGESSYHLDTYELESDDSRCHFDHLIDLISGDYELCGLLKDRPVRMGLQWDSVSGQGGPTFSQKQQKFLWENRIPLSLKITRSSPPEIQLDAKTPANPNHHECCCGFRVYSQQGAESLKLGPITGNETLDSIRWKSHFEDEYGAVFLYGSNAEEHAQVCAQQLQTILLSNLGLVDFCKSQKDFYDILNNSPHGLEYKWITDGNFHKVKLAPDFWRPGLELACNVTFFFTIFGGSYHYRT